MRTLDTKFIKMFSLAAGALVALSIQAADYPAPKEADWVARDFRFHSGETLPEVRLHFTTIGAPSGEPVLLLHGTAGSGATLLTKDFAGELFGPGQPLDASRYFIILPDALGTGKSTRPSDGLRARFPKYNYDDMVLAQYRLVTEGLSIKHLRLVLGNSMGGMQTWIWGMKYPDFMDALVPMACQPTEMSGRNWMLRRMLADAIRNDPEWNGGNYTAQPRGMQRILVQFGIATSGGSQAFYKQAPTREKADAIVAQRLAQPFRGDANGARDPRARDQAREERSLRPHPGERRHAGTWDHRQRGAVETTPRGFAAEGAANGEVAQVLELAADSSASP